MLREEINKTSLQEQIKAFDVAIQAMIDDKVLDKYVELGMDLSTIPIKYLIELYFLCQENDAIPSNCDPLEPESSNLKADEYTAERLD